VHSGEATRYSIRRFAKFKLVLSCSGYSYVRRFVYTALVAGLCLVSACTQESHTYSVKLFATEETPPLLSNWGVVQREKGKLKLGKNVLPFDLNTPLFTDYAHKLRTVWIPPGKFAQFSPDDNFDFPLGTILSKTFYYPRSTQAASSPTTLLANDDYSTDFTRHELDLDKVYLVETRLLVHQKSGWQALAYIWNEAQNEARLEIAGDIKTLTLKMANGDTNNFYYVIPTRNECASCHASDHTSGKLVPIGTKARHLKKIYRYYNSETSSAPANQLITWQAKGLLDGLPNIDSVTSNAQWNASSRDQLTHRARSYLDINCSHCHNPKGPADTSGLFLHMAELTPRRLGNCKPPVAAGRGSGNFEFAIVPGKANQSILTFRMQSIDPGEMMPELGRSTVHTEGLELINEWINSLPGDCV